jgi:hypothetical protein
MPALSPVFSAVLIGYLLVKAVRPAFRARPGWAAALFELSLGTGFGIGITSSVFFALLVTGAASPVTILVLDGVMVVGLGALVYFRRGRPSGTSALEKPGFRWNWVLALALAGAVLLAVAALAAMAESNRHGMWDAWAIWNIRAKFLAGPGETWRNAVSPLLSRTHPDYPLLLSGFIGRAWKVSGGYDAAVPVATAFLFFGASLALLVSSLAMLRSLSSALLAGLVMFTNVAYMGQPMALYADVPLGYYYLASIVLVLLAWFSEGSGKRALLVLAGLSAGMAGWTKNEGLLFLLVIAASYALAEWIFEGFRKAIARVPWMLAGMLPGLILTAGLKLMLAPAADPVVTNAAGRLSQGASNFGRMWWVVEQVYKQALNLGSGITHPLLILAVLLIALRFSIPKQNRAPVAFGALVLALVFAGYCIVSVGAFTPFERFYAQLWHAFLFVIFMAVRPAEETMAAAPVSRKKTKTKKSRP